MAKFKLKRWDSEAQANGKWMEYDGGEFLIAAVPNDNFTKAFVKLQEEFATDIPTEELNKVLATTVLKDWKNVEGEDEETGEEVDLDYSVEFAVELLTLDTPFSNWLLAQARENDNYKRESKEKRSKK